MTNEGTKTTAVQSDEGTSAVGELAGPRGAITLRSRAEDLAEAVSRVREAGIGGVEIDAGALDVLYRGRLNTTRLKEVARLVASSGLGVSVHQCSSLDLRTDHEVGVMRDLLFSLVELSQELEASVLVIHYEKPSDDPGVEEQFEQLLLAAAERAVGLVIGVENIEVAPSGKVVDLIERLGHPAIKMTWDVGHDVLAADRFGYDLGKAAERCAPHVAHVHAQDNFGSFEPTRLDDRPTYARKGKVHWSALGRGDLHLPIGWGTIPWEELLTPLRTRQYRGIVVSEVLERFHDWHLDEITAGLRYVLECLTPVDERSIREQS